MLEEVVIEKDGQIYQQKFNQELDKKWANVADQINEKKQELSKCKDDFDFISDLHAKFRMRATNKKPDRSKCSNKCSSPICISDMVDKTNEHHNWVQCDRCDKWFHPCCVALSITEIQFDLLDDNAEFICPLCEGKFASGEQMLNLQIECLRLKQNKLTEFENSIKALNEVLQAHMNTAQKATGPLQIQLLSVLEELKITKQAYHSNCFVGNHVKKMFDNHEKIVNVLSQFPEEFSLYSKLFKDFSQIHSLLNTSKFLSLSEISSFQELLYDFGN